VLSRILATGEQIEKAYQLIRNLSIITNKQLILVDKQGITGNMVKYRSLPYKNVTHFSVETARHFDLMQS
jgi:Bacterial PH domain